MRQIQYPVITAPLSTNPETITIDKWLSTYPDQFINYKHNEQTGKSFEPRSTSFKETITIDKWFRLSAQPVKITSIKTIYLSNTVRNKDTAYIDKWMPNYPNQFINYKHFEQHGKSFEPRLTSFKETILLNEWEFKQSYQVSKGLFFNNTLNVSPLAPIAQTETVTLDKWFRPLSEPIRINNIQPIYLSYPLLTGKETVFLDNWSPTYPSQFINYKHNEQAGTNTLQLLASFGEVIKLDKWEPNYPIQFINKIHREQFGKNFDSLPTTFKETISLDKWSPNYPDQFIFLKHFEQHGKAFEPQLTPWVEKTQVDKWEPVYPYKTYSLGLPVFEQQTIGVEPIAPSVNMTWFLNTPNPYPKPFIQTRDGIYPLLFIPGIFIFGSIIPIIERTQINIIEKTQIVIIE